MLEISILKVENPFCLWGRIVKGAGTDPESPKEYDDLQVKMNLFYHEVNQDVQKIKPSSIDEGQVCVVYFSALKSWCRAIVESLFLGTVGSQAMCFLVDHGEHIIVCSDEVRSPLEKFLQLPFWVRKFQLAGIHPMRLQVSICKEKAELIPSNQWDSSATRYLHNLLQASTQMEAVFRETHADSTFIELYLTIKNVKICVNDDLVTKRFACFSSEKTHSSAQNGIVDRSPAILACDIFSDTERFLATNGCTIRSLSPWQDPTVVTKVTNQRPVTTSGQVALQSSNEVSEGQEKFTKLSEGDKKKVHNRSQHSELDSDERHHGLGEDTETSLVAELLKNLNLIRFLKFLNPASSAQRPIPNTDLDEENEDDDVQGISGAKAEEELVSATQQTMDETVVCNGECKTDDPIQQQGTEPSTPTDQAGVLTQEAFAEQPTIEDELACARLLQLLNPDPLNSDVDSSDVTLIRSDPSSSGIVVHSAFTLDPCTSLANAPITDTFRRILVRKKYARPSVAESYCWPAVARGCDTVLISHSGDEPLTYLPPFLAHMQLSSVFSTLSSHTGPIAVILCPGWEKAQTVFDLLEECHTGQSLHPMIALVGLGKDEAKMFKIQNNCQMVVTTPFSLVRLMAFHCFLFLRLCHLVLDEVDLLYSQAPDEMATILQHFQKVTDSGGRASCPRQIIAVGKRWSSQIGGLLADHMSNPCIIITVTEEAALYGNVHQMILMCLDCTKISVLLGSLDFNPEVAQKTLIIANSAEEVEHVFKGVSNTSAFSLKAHEGLTYQFDFVIEQWKKDIGLGTHVILVTTNECMKALGVRDATCVVHYGFPSSPKLFGSRLFCMSENFQNLSDKEKNAAHPVKSIMLLSERNARHVIGVLRYLKRTEASLPPELLHFAQGVLQAKEEQKTDRPLCSYLKSFGFCRDSSVCPYRHSISPKQDQPLHRDSGTIVILPLHIKTASLYYGRIVSKKDDCYESLAAEMVSHYANEKLCAKEVLEGGLYGVQEEEVYHRVRVTSVPDEGGRLFSSVMVLFLDEGREQKVKAHQLLQLPAHFHSLLPQAVEIIVCRAKPSDGEVDWNPKVTRVICQKIKGLQHQAKVVLSLGNTVFVDPMVRMTRLPGLKTLINEYNVHAEIMNTGMGTSNPQHLDLLKELCQGAVPASVGEVTHSMRPEGSEVTQEDMMQAAEETLAHRMKAAIESLRCNQEVSADPPQALTELLADPEPFEAPVPVATQPKMEQWNSLIANLTNATQMLRSTGLKGFSPKEWISAVQSPCENGHLMDDKQVINVEKISSVDRAIAVDSLKSFHPQIKWFQRDDTVILRIKLISPVAQRCEFFPGRVVFSATVNDRPYRADLELHSTIAAERCSWEMKCNEPVIKLMKKERGDWKMLLKQKSSFVSLDFDHFEENEEKIPNGRLFVEHTGEEGCYVSSESGSESD